MSKYDISKMTVTNESYASFKNPRQKSKYDELFSKVTYDMRLRCPIGSAARVSTGFKKWLIQRGHTNPVVRSREDCGDGMGGVWWLDEDKPARSPARTSLAGSTRPPSHRRGT